MKNNCLAARLQSELEDPLQRQTEKCPVFLKIHEPTGGCFNSQSWSVRATSQRGVVGVEAVVGTVTGCSPRSRDGVSSGGGGLFFWASSFSVSWVYSSFTGSLLCGHRGTVSHEVSVHTIHETLCTQLYLMYTCALFKSCNVKLLLLT